MPIEAVFFDLGGTLARPLPAHHTQANLNDCAARHGLEAKPAVLWETYQSARAQLDSQWAARSAFLHGDLVRAAYRATAERLGAAVRTDIEEAFAAGQRASVVTHLELRDDAAGTLAALAARGLKLAVVSNIDEDYLRPLARRFDLHRWCDPVLSSEVAGSCKPHPAIFEQAMAAVGVAPQSVLFVGDSLRCDIDGAARLGCTTTFLPGETNDDGSRADFSIERLADLQKVVAQLG